MNYDLAMMALEGLRRAPLSVEVTRDRVRIEGDAAGFRELARLCLLLGGESGQEGDGFELEPPTHLTKGASALHLRRAR